MRNYCQQLTTPVTPAKLLHFVTIVFLQSARLVLYSLCQLEISLAGINSTNLESIETIMTIINTNQVTIDTVTPALQLGQIQLSADKRGKELSDAERIRRVVLPAGHWGNLEATTNGARLQGLTEILQNSLKQLASDKLRDLLNENPVLRIVDLDQFSISALLSWSSETSSSRGSITFTREQVETWFPTSALATTYADKGKAVLDFLQNRLATLSAKNHGLKKPEDALKLITLLADDAATPLVTDLIQRLTHIEKALTARTSEAISLDDL